jgi:hypothetical protein
MEPGLCSVGLVIRVSRWHRWPRTSSRGYHPPSHYAAGNPLFFVDPLGLKVVIQNPDTADSYDQLKQCFPLFRQIAQHFEDDTWTVFGPDRTWTIKDPDFTPASCGVGGRTSEKRTIWVPPGRDCEGTMRCLMHEFYELWLIRVGGYPRSQIGAGPADDMARRFEEHIPMERCCPCN